MPESDDFDQYRLLILGELKRLTESTARLEAKFDAFKDKDLSDLRVEIALLKFKSGLVGGLGGTLAGGIIASIVAKLLR